VTFGACCVLLLGVGLAYIMTRSKPVYLVDYHCYKAPARSAASLLTLPKFWQRLGEFQPRWHGIPQSWWFWYM